MTHARKARSLPVVLCALSLPLSTQAAKTAEAAPALLEELVTEFSGHFGYDASVILSRPFTKLIPLSLRPYGRLYAY